MKHRPVTLSELIRMRGVTQAGLARKLGITRSDISRLASGEHGLDPLRARSIAIAMRAAMQFTPDAKIVFMPLEWAKGVRKCSKS